VQQTGGDFKLLGALVAGRHQQGQIALPQSDAIDQAPRGQQGDHLRIHGLADAIDHIAQGVRILKVEGREELREQVQRPGRLAHQLWRLSRMQMILV
jgi:hypothetical protein